MSIKQAIEAQRVLSDDAVLRLRSEHGWAKETIRSIEAEVISALRSMPAEPDKGTHAWFVDFMGKKRAERSAPIAQSGDDKSEFEAHFKHLDFTMDKDGWGRDVYVHPHVYSLWCGWQAARATPQTEAVRMSEAEILASWSGSDAATRPVLGSKKVIAFARAVEQATADRLGVKMGDV